MSKEKYDIDALFIPELEKGKIRKLWSKYEIAILEKYAANNSTAALCKYFKSDPNCENRTKAALANKISELGCRT